jgi:hypothetical protein
MDISITTPVVIEIFLVQVSLGGTLGEVPENRDQTQPPVRTESQKQFAVDLSTCFTELDSGFGWSR